LGGTTNFAVDREAAEHIASAFGGLDNASADVRANRAFLGRAVNYLAAEVGIRQFLDIGTGIPTENNVHEVAQRVAPTSRIVYVDYDLIVLAHASTMLEGTPEGATSYVAADLRDPERILEQAQDTLDFTQPIAVMLMGVLHFVPDSDDVYGVVGRLLKAVPVGSYLVLSHLASDINTEEMAEATRHLNTSTRETFVLTSTRETFVLRDRGHVARFFDGLEVVHPGVVPVDQWRPSKAHQPQSVSPGERTTPLYGAVGRKS
jgi:hypothetical protein